MGAVDEDPPNELRFLRCVLGESLEYGELLLLWIELLLRLDADEEDEDEEEIMMASGLCN